MADKISRIELDWHRSTSMTRILMISLVHRSFGKDHDKIWTLCGLSTVVVETKRDSMQSAKRSLRRYN
jgi:hypothetical protein